MAEWLPPQEPKAKRQRLEDGQQQIDEDALFTTFHSKYGAVNMYSLCNAYEKLFQRDGAFKALQIENSNCTSGSLFRNAYVHVKEHTEKLYLIGPIFESGLRVLHNFLQLKELPGDLNCRRILASLLTYLLNKDTMESLGSVQLARHCQNEKDVTLFVLNHLLLPLRPPTKCVVDWHARWKFFCPDRCENKALEMIESGDTSIGNSDVWHGSVDAVIGNPRRGGAISVTAVHDDDEESCSPGLHACGEFTHSFRDLDTPAPEIISQAIVFSFLQNHRQPENKNALIPTIGISDNEFVICFYDSENDILLQSIGGYSFQESGEKRMMAVLIAWLVVNYKYLSDGFVETLRTAPKANFFEVCKNKIDVYKNAMLYGGVGTGDTRKFSYFKYADATWDVPPSSDRISRLEPFKEK